MRKKIVMMVLLLVVMSSVCGCNSSDYRKAAELRDAKEYEQAYAIYAALGNYKDSEELAVECSYLLGKEYYKREEYSEAVECWKKCGDYEDSVALLKDASIKLAQEYCQEEKYDNAIEVLGSLPEDEAIVKALQVCKYYKADYLIRQKMYDEAEIILNEIKNNMSVDELIQACNYGKGVLLYEAKKYDEAVEKLLASNMDGDTEKFLITMAKDYMDKKNYDQVKKICSAIPGNKDGAKLLKKVQMNEKYSKFRKLSGRYETEKAMTRKEAEEFLKENVYGEWKDYETGKAHNIDETTRDGRLYGIYAVIEDSLIWWYYIYYYDMENPDKIYCESWHERNVVSERGGISQPFLESAEREGFYSDDHAYGKMSESEVEEYLQNLPESKSVNEISEEEKNALYNQVKNDFNSYYKSKFTETRGWYTTVRYPSIDGMVFEYDSATEICTIRFTATTCSNVFDFYGTSDSTVSVVAQYKRDGNVFTLVNISEE